MIALCKTADAAKRDLVVGEETGAIWTRTGRPFFNDKAMTEGLLARLRSAVDSAGLGEELDTDWLLLDAEIMPWSAKAGSLIESQYAPVAASSRGGFAAAAEAFARASDRGLEIATIRDPPIVQNVPRSAARPGHRTYGRCPVSAISKSRPSIFSQARDGFGLIRITSGT